MSKLTEEELKEVAKKYSELLTGSPEPWSSHYERVKEISLILEALEWGRMKTKEREYLKGVEHFQDIL